MSKGAMRNVLAFTVVGLYVVVTLALLGYNFFTPGGDISHFFDQMSKANFLLGPLGFVLGYYFAEKRERADLNPKTPAPQTSPPPSTSSETPSGKPR